MKNMKNLILLLLILFFVLSCSTNHDKYFKKIEGT